MTANVGRRELRALTGAGADGVEQIVVSSADDLAATR